MQVDIATLDNAVNAFMAKYSVPGLSIAILKNEKLVYAKGYGVANQATGEPVTTSSLFPGSQRLKIHYGHEPR